MKLQKKLVSLLAAALLVFGVAACNGDTAEEDPAADPAATEAPAAGDTATEDPLMEDPAATETPAG